MNAVTNSLATPFVIAKPLSACGVYHLLRDSQVVYIGQTRNILQRLGGHDVKDYDRAAFFACDAAELDAMEKLHIETYLPTLNAEGVSKPYRAVRRYPTAKGQWIAPDTAEGVSP